MTIENIEVAASPLKSLQHQMLAWLQEHNPQIKQAVTGTEKVPADLRLDIYANAYRFRLVEALQDTFPALHTLLGDEEFFKLGVEYLTAKPSTHFSLRYFGHQLSAFLATSQTYNDQPILSEMAQFEWLLREAFDAADSTILDLESLQQIDPQAWPELRFGFLPGLNRIDLSYNTPQLWQAIDQQQPPIDIIENDYPIAWCLWRKDLRTLYRSMAVDEAWAMDAMRSGHHFTDVCSGVCEWVDEQHAAVRVAGFVQNWINEGMIQKVL